MASKILLIDDLGQPVPQYYNSSTGTYEALEGSGGAMNINIGTSGSSAIPVMLKCSDGSSTLDVTTSGVPVVASNLPSEYTVVSKSGTPLQVSVADASVPVGVKDLALGQEINGVAGAITNSKRSAACFACVKITSGSGTLSGLKMKAVINSVEVDYRTVTIDPAISSGNALFVFEGPLPYIFKLEPVFSSGSLVTTIDVQLP